jgi:hypothetical protein
LVLVSVSALGAMMRRSTHPRSADRGIRCGHLRYPTRTSQHTAPPAPRCHCHCHCHCHTTPAAASYRGDPLTSSDHVVVVVTHTTPQREKAEHEAKALQARIDEETAQQEAAVKHQEKLMKKMK